MFFSIVVSFANLNVQLFKQKMREKRKQKKEKEKKTMFNSDSLLGEFIELAMCLTNWRFMSIKRVPSVVVAL